MRHETIATAFRGDVPLRFDNVYTRAELLTSAYRYHRETPTMTAARALEWARKDTDLDRRRYPRRADSDGWQPRFTAWGESHVRWVERLDAAGLRFVGYADELAPLDHTGWYLDSDGCGETVRGAVYQLPARDGRPRYVAGFPDPWNNGPCCVSLDNVTADEREAARWADRMAERMAEDEREYREASGAAYEYAEAAAEIRDEYTAIRELRADVRHVRSRLDDGRLPEHMCSEIRAAVWRHVDRIHKLRERRAELWAEHSSSDVFLEIVCEESAA